MNAGPLADSAAPSALNVASGSPWLPLLGATAAVAALLVVWLWQRHSGGGSAQPQRAWLAGLTALTLFLTIDLIVFGAFTRLSDSGLGCPDWPGCYGSAHPWAAQTPIEQAQAAMPHGPVTWAKAWIEMSHRYLAMLVGALILVLAAASLWWRRVLALPWGWPLATLAWVLVQGLFGKYTVTLKLYPAIVTLHWLGAVLLLALLVVQHEAYRARPLLAGPAPDEASHGWPPLLHRALLAAIALLGLQLALGAWVSTNYAVLACQGFPQCNGAWWPEADFEQGFTWLRPLGRTAQGSFLPFDALVAIHWAHRCMALLVALVLSWLACALWRRGGTEAHYGQALAGLLSLQLLSGVGNVVWQWPLLGALAHSAGAALLMALLVSLRVRSRARVASQPISQQRSKAHTGGWDAARQSHVVRGMS